MSKKTKALLIFTGTVAIVSILESFIPFVPFIELGCFVTYMLGRWEVKNGL